MKTALVLLATGFEETEAVTIIDVLRRGEIDVTSASLGDTLVQGAHDIVVKADTKLDELNDDKIFDAVILPGGMGGTENLMGSNAVIKILQRHASSSKIVGAICAAPWVLEKADLLDDRKVTIYPGLEGKLCSAAAIVTDHVVSDGNIITSKGPGTAMEFAVALVGRLAGEDVAGQVAAGLLFSPSV